LFGISGFKLLIIVIAVLVLVGPDKLPEIARTIGKMITLFKAARADMERMIKEGLDTAESLNPLAEQVAEDSSATGAAVTLATASDGDDEEEEEE
jgi:TatA/E family protein of Tat protein translocase